MKAINKLLSLFTIVLVLVTTLGMAAKKEVTQWNVDKSHSSITFQVRHFFSNVPGSFSEWEAEIYFDPKNLGESSINATIQTSSISTNHERRDSDLRSETFFESEKYPTMTFVSESIEATGENTFVAKGTLTARDVSKTFEIPFTLLGVRDHPWNQERKIAGITSEFIFMRNEFGIGSGNFATDAVVGNEVNVTINLELNANK